MIRALVIGAGAVGQVYGSHLARAGVQVAAFVKPGQADDAARGFTVHRHRLFRAPVTETFTPAEVITSPEEVEGSRWDLVFLCVPTSALEGIEPVLRGVGGATVVAFQPGLHALARLEGIVPPAHLVTGTIAFLAYAAPLEGESLAPGTAVFHPPLAATLLSGEAPRVDALVELLRRGGCPARAHPDAHVATTFSTSALMPQITALHAAGWSFDALLAGNWLTLAARAASEAMEVAAAETGEKPPLSRHLLRPLLLRLLVRLSPLLLPFDLERYLRAHFTKVNAQSRLLLEDYRASARRHGLDADALERLYVRVHG